MPWHLTIFMGSHLNYTEPISISLETFSPLGYVTMSSIVVRRSSVLGFTVRLTESAVLIPWEQGSVFLRNVIKRGRVLR